MARLRNWPSRFAALVDSARLQPFEWGVHDCCLWAANAVLALTGADPAAAWRGRYSSAAGAMRFLEELGGLDGAGVCTGVQIAPALVMVGDVGRVTWPCGTESLAVCSGHDWMVAGECGLLRLSLDAASKAWGVGRE